MPNNEGAYLGKVFVPGYGMGTLAIAHHCQGSCPDGLQALLCLPCRVGVQLVIQGLHNKMPHLTYTKPSISMAVCMLEF
jgi:hypothetical protein